MHLLLSSLIVISRRISVGIGLATGKQVAETRKLALTSWRETGTNPMVHQRYIALPASHSSNFQVPWEKKG
ncbi:hypothetical protein SADUNF_Sadunf15G0062600 [Salix dunnii]|uniref:Uncharacterized protein n=1 Tax=Salix dunnii TaxID=1413687 RepID=A0A835JCB2_9ROSI|nr:hypothetical protein SADUNF_Sadunf15G0062600 [Salix dunnii]